MASTEAEKSVRSAHDQFLALIDHSPLRVYLVDSEFRLHLISEKARPTFGTVKNPIGRDFAEVLNILWPPAIAAEVIKRFRHTLVTGEPYFERGFSGLRADSNTTEYYDWEIHRIVMPDGQNGVACYFIDISPHILAQQAFMRSENRKSAILSASLDAIITMDHSGKISDFNAAAERIFGYSHKDVSEKPLAELIIPERFRQRHYEGLARYLASGEGPVLGKRLELPALRSNGEEFPVELSISRIPDTEPPMFTATVRDISDRKDAEKALLERAQLAALRAEISTALATNDDFQTVLQRCALALVTHLEGAFARFWTVNETEQMLEMQASAGMYTHLDGPHGRVKMGEFKIGRIAQNRTPHLTNDVAHDPNISNPNWAKKEGMVAFAGCPLVLEGKVIGVMAMFAKHALSKNVLDEFLVIAEGIAQWVQRKRAEESLAKAQLELKNHATTLEATVAERTAQLREKVGELEAFSYSVSHDLRSPLRAMQGYSGALLADHKQSLDEEAQQYLEKIHKASTRLDLLIQEILNYSRLARQELTLGPVNLEHLVSEVSQAYPALQPPKVHITVTGPLPIVQGNEALLTQLISNLLSNAVKFVRPGTTPTIRVHGEETETMARIWFDDNGIGIDPTHFKRIFEIFGRVYGDKKFEGTGIGLAVAKKAVERMGGRIGVQSQLGTGSRFWFELKKA